MTMADEFIELKELLCMAEELEWLEAAFVCGLAVVAFVEGGCC